MPSSTVTTELILQLIPLAIQAFGAISAEVLQLRAAAGLSDEQLLSHAEQTDQQTLDLIQQHLAELAASDKIAVATAEPPAAPETPTAAPSKEAPPETPAVPTPAEVPTSAPIVAPSGALVHGQN